MNPKLANAWSALERHHQQMASVHLNDLFALQPERFKAFSVQAAGWLLDFSKNHLDQETLSLLRALAEACELPKAIEAMFTGKKINLTEQRAVGHVALRDMRPASEADDFVVDGQIVRAAVCEVRERCARFADQVRNGQWLGFSGQRIRSIVNIGIGGSDLGPQMATLALKEFATDQLQIHFVSNVDGQNLGDVLAHCDPQSTLFIVVSKTFTTQETMANAHAARVWFLNQGGRELHRHFVAVSTNQSAVQAFGIDPANMFEFWDWVGGRYSIWSAVGLALMLSIGSRRFEEFLEGAHAMDQHFRHSALKENMPVIMALIEVWYRNFRAVHSRCIAPYHHRLQRFPAYLQQLEMESLGKSVDAAGQALARHSGLVIWGEPGTNGQHAYFQLLHQGTEVIPVDFLLFAQADSALQEQHQLLLANGLAQSRALMVGRSLQASDGAPHKTFAGNRPSNTLVTQRLTPASLGALIALYEHKVFAASVLWGINAFDQWGVELGKVLAKQTEQLLEPDSGVGRQDSDWDSSTLGLAAFLRSRR